MTTRPVRIYLLSRGVPINTGVMLGGIVGVVLLSTSDAGLFSLVADGVTPLARLVTVIVGLSLGAPLTPGFEEDYVSPLRRDVRAVHLVAVLVASILVGFLLALLLAEPTPWALPRLVMFWTFLSISSAALLGGRFGWVLPIVLSVVLSLFSAPDAQSSWNIVMSTQHTPVLWGILAVTVGVGAWSALR